MAFWIAFMVIAIVVVSWVAILEIVKLGTRYYENIERIKRGYPTIKGEVPIGAAVEKAPAKKADEPEYIDYTNRN